MTKLLLKCMGRRTAESISACVPFNALHHLSGVGPVIVYYHTVGEEPLPHVTPLYRHKTPREFAADLDWLLGQLPALEIGDVLAAARGESCPRGFFVTFDDGLREVAEVAAPILRQKGVPAAVFLNPPFLDNHGMFYRFKAALILRCLPLAGNSVLGEAARILSRPGASVPALCAEVRNIDCRDAAVLDVLAAVCGVDFPDYLRRQRPYLTFAQAADLQRDGWTLGAHSLDHPRYAELTLEEQLWQTSESLRMVTDLFGPAQRVFAFPFDADGVGDAFYAAARDQLKIDACFGTGGWFHEPARRLLNRISLEGEKPPAGRFLRQSLGLACLRPRR